MRTLLGRLLTLVACITLALHQRFCETVGHDRAEKDTLRDMVKDIDRRDKLRNGRDHTSTSPMKTLLWAADGTGSSADLLVSQLLAPRGDRKRTANRRSRVRRFAPLRWFYNGMKSTLITEAVHQKRALGSRGLCYHGLGCFTLRDRMRLPYGFPQSPKSIDTQFWLDCAQEGGNRRSLKATKPSSESSLVGCSPTGERPLVAIIHGFSESAEAAWVTDMANAFMKVVGANVLLVDWRNGAAAPMYSLAAANTALVGAELSVVLQLLMKADASLTPAKVHLVGFSLGAHVAGFCGRHFLMQTGRTIGRITALDPAGPLFEGTNVTVSRGDADFVDVIHTNMGHLDGFQFGLAAPVGDVDFFPNGGSLQPGCFRIGCSHRRAHALMIESITNHGCVFVSRQLTGHGSGHKNVINSRSLREDDVKARGAMGYDSVRAKGRGIQYLETRSEPPFCTNCTITSSC
ncbi:pancreatic lipase-related protein 2-like isoform X1 [Amblyomma americanum]